MGPVYYFPDHPSNKMTSGFLHCYVSFQSVHHNHLNNLTLWNLKEIIGGQICDTKI